MTVRQMREWLYEHGYRGVAQDAPSHVVRSLYRELSTPNPRPTRRTDRNAGI